jgi:hypothetical protein
MSNRFAALENLDIEGELGKLLERISTFLPKGV